MDEEKDQGKWRKALITGGAGFVGSHLAERLLSSDVETRILDNFSSGFRSNVPKGAILIEGDVRKEEDVEIASRDADVIFHLAEFIPNNPGHIIRYSSSNPRSDLDVCVGGTINVLDKARKNDSQFVLTSTAAVYGSGSLPLREDSKTLPISPYGVAKLCAEEYAELYHRSYGIPVTIFRFFNLFGPRQRKYLMYDCLNKMNENPKRVELLGDGKEVRDYIFVNDAIDQVLALSKLPTDSESIFNIGSGAGRTTLEIAQTLARHLGINPEFVLLGNPWPGNSSGLVADVSKSKSYLGEVLTDFDESLGHLISWYRNQASSQARI
ncbi:MAG: NAD-dependent epimerase/dehydratase family protein [Nitrososphaerota archaeon]|nr:NAD-dependent epimerase/dehydratase family protein [Nitrososphaerota archaeon]